MNEHCQAKMLNILQGIRKARKRVRINQAEMALYLGCNQSQYSKKEKGIQQFTLAEYLHICDILSLETYPCANCTGRKIGFKGGALHEFEEPVTEQIISGIENTEKVIEGMVEGGANGQHNTGGLFYQTLDIDGFLLPITVL